MPNILNNGDHGFGFGLMIGHGIIQGAISAIRGGKFKTGLISGMVSKASSALIGLTSLSQATPFVKMSIVSIISGAAAKASGGDFVQGALSAMVVWLYNDWWSDLKNKVRGYYSSAKNKVKNYYTSVKNSVVSFTRKYAQALSNGVSYVANGAQLIAGAALSTTGWGALLGVPMMAHAINNLIETYTGEDWYIRKGEEALGLNYDYADIAISAISGIAGATKQVGFRVVRYLETDTIVGYVPKYNIQTVSGRIDAYVTGAGMVNTAMGISDE